MPLSGGADVCVSDIEVDELVDVCDVLDVGSEVGLVLLDVELADVVVDEADVEVDVVVVLELDEVAVLDGDGPVELDDEDVGEGEVDVDALLDVVELGGGGGGGGGGSAVVVLVLVGVELAVVGGPCSVCVREARMVTFATAVLAPSEASNVTDHVPVPW